MPYIRQIERKVIHKTPVNELPAMGIGDVNYAISKIVHNYLKQVGLKYAHINSVIGVLECAKLELYRQIAAPYENKKKMENGSVSDLDAKSMEDVR